MTTALRPDSEPPTLPRVCFHSSLPPALPTPMPELMRIGFQSRRDLGDMTHPPTGGSSSNSGLPGSSSSSS